MRYSLAAFGLVLLSGCATAPLSPEMQARLDKISSVRQPAASSSGAFKVSDERDPVALRARSAPTGIAGGFSCNVGVEQLGDSKYASDRIPRLEAVLTAAFPARSPGALVVRRYDIFLNHTAETNSETWNAALGGGMIAPMIAPMPDSGSQKITRKARCQRDSMKYGWFDPVDLSNNNPPVTIDMDVTVFERNYVINTAYSPEVDFYKLGYDYGIESRPEAHAALESTLQGAMTKAEAKLVDSIKASEPQATVAEPPAVQPSTAVAVEAQPK